MALLYPWATKEYLLWEMSIGQIVLYHNIGMDIKYGTGEETGTGKPTLANKSHAELKAIRDEFREKGLLEKRQEEERVNDDAKAEFRAKYGDID